MIQLVPLRQRDPRQTRQTLLEAAAMEFHRSGFQATSLNDILALTGVTKGALYHHFANKMELGYAVVDEVIREEVRNRWIVPLKNFADPIEGIQQTIITAGNDIDAEFIELGCPCNNLAQEMTTVDDGFRERIESIYNEWRSGTAEALRRGQQTGHVRVDVNCEECASMVVASLEGSMGLAKNARSAELLFECGRGIMHYLDQLRPKE